MYIDNSFMSTNTILPVLALVHFGHIILEVYMVKSGELCKHIEAIV